MPCIWITGLSGSGKTTLATELVAVLRRETVAVVSLDGDVLREVFGAATIDGTNHSRQARISLALKYAHLCKVLSEQGLTVVIATISLFGEVHRWNRESVPGYFEVFLDVPLAELRRRDPKGIYQAFDAGEIRDVAGLDLPVDLPEAPDLVLSFSGKETATVLAEQTLDAYRRAVTCED